MPCDTKLKQGQTISERIIEVKKVVSRLDQMLAAGKVRTKISREGAVAFEGVSAEDRDGVTDACVYRRILATGSALARAALEKAEMLAGRKIDKKVVGSGLHSHDGGKSWHHH